MASRGFAIFLHATGLRFRVSPLVVPAILRPVLHPALAPTPAQAGPGATAAPSLLPRLLFFATLALLWFILCRDLSLEWSSNEQYSYGWFVPFFAAFLFWLRFEDKGERLKAKVEAVAADSPPSIFLLSTFYFLLLAALLPIRLFEYANPDWRPLSWLHALSVVGLTLLVIGYWGGGKAVRHFAFPVCFILVAVPWLTPIEAPLVQWLMRLVAAVATETLTLLGIPAQLEGNLIRVNNGVVGVSEACSGVRSLQTSLMIGLLFGELKRLTIVRRVALVAAALAIALLANFGRALFLVWIAATQNLAAVERWHDIAGYAIVGAVFLGTLAIAEVIAKGERGSSAARRLPVVDVRSPISNFRLPPTFFLLSTFAFLLSIEAAVSIWYLWHERNFVPTKAWTVHWPEDAPGFRELPMAENIRSTLRYDSGREAMWRVDLAPNEQSTPVSCTMFFFRWEPGSASILRARAHRPDICLPSSGWRLTSDAGVRNYPVAQGLELPFRHFRFLRELGEGRRVFAEAFFCQREDRVPPPGPDRFDTTGGQTGTWMRNDRVRVVAHGLRNQGQQVLEMVILMPNKMENDKVEGVFAKLAREVVVERKKSEG